MDKITTIKVKESLRTELKVLAAMNQISMQEMIKIMLDSYKKPIKGVN